VCRAEASLYILKQICQRFIKILSNTNHAFGAATLTTRFFAAGHFVINKDKFEHRFLIVGTQNTFPLQRGSKDGVEVGADLGKFNLAHDGPFGYALGTPALILPKMKQAQKSS
jgi:hypothetical protein